ELWLEGQGASQFKTFLVDVGHVTGRDIGSVAQADQLKQLQGLASSVAAKRGFGPKGHAGLYIFTAGHASQYTDELEGAGHAQSGDFVRRQADQFVGPQADAT